jgi:hypothetical protein
MKEVYEAKAKSPAASSCTSLSMEKSQSDRDSLDPDQIDKQITGLIKYDSSSVQNTLTNDSPFVHGRHTSHGDSFGQIFGANGVEKK